VEWPVSENEGVERKKERDYVLFKHPSGDYRLR